MCLRWNRRLIHSQGKSAPVDANRYLMSCWSCSSQKMLVRSRFQSGYSTAQSRREGDCHRAVQSQFHKYSPPPCSLTVRCIEVTAGACHGYEAFEPTLHDCLPVIQTSYPRSTPGTFSWAHISRTASVSKQARISTTVKSLIEVQSLSPWAVPEMRSSQLMRHD